MINHYHNYSETNMIIKFCSNGVVFMSCKKNYISRITGLIYNISKKGVK